MSETPDQNRAQPAAKTTQRERLAQALRENLKRRKQQIRERSTGEPLKPDATAETS